MRAFKNPNFYVLLLLITTLVLAFTTYHFASQNSKALESMQQNIDSDFLSSLRRVDENIKEISGSPNSAKLQQLQDAVSQATVLVKYTSYAKEEPYLNSVFGQMNNLILSFTYIPISFTVDTKNKWSQLINDMIQDPTDFEVLNELVESIDRLRRSGS
ncbi:hypothetical protein B9G55_19340 [Saccharibacillus sp. O16]|nr:hypothetical protein B9G55_19340 [Saccharibacillus sp. O16]